MRNSDLLLTFAAAGLLLVAVQGPASAYIDPGTGSYLLSLAVAGVLGGLYVIKSYWRRIRERITGLFGKQKEE